MKHLIGIVVVGMEAEPIGIGTVLVLIGIALNIIDDLFADLVDVSLSGWGWFLILIGVVIIVVRLLWMFDSG